MKGDCTASYRQQWPAQEKYTQNQNCLETVHDYHLRTGQFERYHCGGSEANMQRTKV